MPFTIEATINESSTTRVYRAFDETLQRRVLLKVLHKHLASDERLRERFVREARACAALHSEYIVQVFDLTEIEGAPAIVMEYIEGNSLKDMIAEEAMRTFALASKVALHVLRGLKVAHGRGIIHRDIKPGNILVAVDGTVKVTDFGLARIAVAPTVTAEGMLIGTPAYFAPEQLRGEQSDERTDFFSLGATLVEVLSGERLFEGATYAECLNKVAAFNVDALDRFAPHASAEFLVFVKRLMHPDKDRRFASADEALTGFHDREPISPILLHSAAGYSWKRSSVIAGVLATIAIGLFGVASLVHHSASGSGLPVVNEEHTMLDSAQKASPSSLLVGTLHEKSHDVPKEEQVSSLAQRSKNEIKSPHDSGSVLITSTPWAKVYIDSMLIGETPLDAPLMLASGSHTVVFTHPSFEPVIKKLTIARNVRTSIDCNFLESAGFLRCIANPWAEIYVDDINRGTTPLDKAILLSAGAHRVRYHNPSFNDIYRTVTILAQDTLNLSVSFYQ